MEEILKLIGDYGVTAILFGGLILLFAKYIPSLMNIWIERLKAKNSANDLLFETIRNNSQIIENNSRVIENNTVAMQKSSTHYDKINNALDKINGSFCEHDKRAENIAKDLAILKERKWNYD